METPHKTARPRTAPSAPAAYLAKQGLLTGRCLDFGSGRGFDATHFGMESYDPYWQPEWPEWFFDTILCTYVLNVLPARERIGVLRRLLALLKDEDSKAYITVRRDLPKQGIQGRGVYQRYVTLPLELIRETSSFAIYLLTRSGSSSLEIKTIKTMYVQEDHHIWSFNRKAMLAVSSGTPWKEAGRRTKYKRRRTTQRWESLPSTLTENPDGTLSSVRKNVLVFTDDQEAEFTLLAGER